MLVWGREKATPKRRIWEAFIKKMKDNRKRRGWEEVLLE